MPRAALLHVITLVLMLPTGAPAQDLEALAKDPVRFLRTAEQHLHWHEPAEPTRIVGNLYFVGTRGLAVYLLTGPAGHVLINTGMPDSGPMIAASIRKLGFKPEDVRILLAGHAHVDHVGGHAFIQKLSGARVALMADEVALFESGGALDFHYGAHPEFGFEPVKVDRVLRDGDTVTLGDIRVVAWHTPGHTKGATTFCTTVADGAKTYTVVFPNGTSLNPGYRIGKDPSYPGIADDFRRTFALLDTLTPDIWLDAHTDVFDFAGKRTKAARDGAAAWVDPDGYRRWLRTVRAKFDATLAAQS